MQDESRKLNRKVLLTSLISIVLIIVTLILASILKDRNYYISSILIMIYIMVPFFVSFEGKKVKASELVTLSIMCAVAIVSRVCFTFIPNFKPIGGIIIITAMAFGSLNGFICGAISMLASNFIFGQGMWTPWQMFAFGIMGFLAGLLSKFKIMSSDKILRSAVISFFLYMLVCGPILDTCAVFLMPVGVTFKGILSIYIAGIPVNFEQSICTFLTVLILGKPIDKKLNRLKLKYDILQNGI